jgi:hypothetical protein
MKQSIFHVAQAIAVAILATVGSMASAQTATIKGKFVYDGDPPKPVQIECNKDQATCCTMPHFDKSLVVGKDGSIANIVVYVRTRGLKAPADVLAKHKEPVLLDNKTCVFEPHVVGVVTGQKLVIGNSDNVGHNTNIAAQGFNPIVPAGGKVESTPKTVTLIPNEVSCNIHPWMKAWVLVRPDPFFAVSKEDGSFEISGLPVGKEVEFQVWQEKSGFVTDVKLDGKTTAWARGRFKQKLKAGDNDLGEIKVAAKIFNK